MAKKFWAIALAALLLAALLVGCAAQAPSVVEGGEQEESPVAPAEPSAGEGKADDGGSVVIDPGNAAQSGKKIIYNADIVLEAEDASATADKIADQAAKMGGYLSESQVYEDKRDASSYVTVRIPPEKLKEFTTFLGTLGKGISKNVTSQDVTAQYVDLESRLRNAQAQETQLLRLMEKAEKTEDILAVRRELNAVQQEIETVKGQLRLMDNQVGFATVRIFIQQPAPPAVSDGDDLGEGSKIWTFSAVWKRITRGLSESFTWTLNAISGILIAFSYAFVPLLLIAVVVVAIILIVRAAGKRKKTQQAK